jgi:hypothetical protein
MFLVYVKQCLVPTSSAARTGLSRRENRFAPAGSVAPLPIFACVEICGSREANAAKWPMFRADGPKQCRERVGALSLTLAAEGEPA